MENNLVPFHLAFPVKNLKDTKDFYTDILGCSLGRTNEKWIDFNFYGHQITAHLSPESFIKKDISNKVDGKDVPDRLLAQRIEDRLQDVSDRSNFTVAIVTDQTTEFKYITRVMEAAGKLGVQAIIATQPTSE